jgi:hypothetical protein
MIVVKVELWPHGEEARAREIGRARIINDGTGDLARGNYQVELLKSAEYSKRPGTIYKRGTVRGFLRRRGPWPLLMLAIQQAIGSGVLSQ